MLQQIRMAKRRLCKARDGESILRERYARVHGGELGNATFTQKLYRRMIALNRDCPPIYTQIADKYRAREYVRQKLGDGYSTRLLWIGEHPEQIPFDTLPEKSIAKTNHGSGSNIVLDKTTDRSQAIARLRAWLSQNYYWPMREAQYYGIKPCILVEEFIDDGQPSGPLDYRFWCFGGTPRAIQVDDNAHLLNAFYDPDWNNLGISYRSIGAQREVSKPENLNAMLEIAAKLAEPFDFVRVDLFNINGRVYFGEMTFSPTAGSNKFDPPEWDLRFGEMWPKS
jgi:hypothetical protein